jgi:O-antigen/teichoic acid export membrane protein
LTEIKKLAGETIYYGASNIVSRLLNYLLTPLYVAIFLPDIYAQIGIVYAALPFATTIFTYGLETAFFRFSHIEDRKKVLGTGFISILVSTLLLSLLLLSLRGPVSRSVVGSLAGMHLHPEYLTWCVCILVFDTIATLPFAKLRLDNRPIRYALLKVINVVVNVAANLFFLVLCPYLLAHGHTWIRSFYNPRLGVGYVFFSQMISSGVTLLLLLPQILSTSLTFHFPLWKRIMVYSLPLIIVGLAGMVNETLDRVYFLPTFLPASLGLKLKATFIGIYSANYKLSILITLFIQAFRLGAEPFFFRQATGKDPQLIYARVMKYFVMIICMMFLSVALFLSIWKYFMPRAVYWQGLKIVPTLLVANMFLGIYYNLTVWFKLTHQTWAGAVITLVTAGLAVLFNYLWIPVMGYYGAALATMVCYGIQMAICYFWGQRYYPIPYPWKRLAGYILLALGCYGLFWWVNGLIVGTAHPYSLNLASLAVSVTLFAGYGFVLCTIEKIRLGSLLDFRAILGLKKS